MNKDALASVGVIALLLVVIIVALAMNKRQELVATRPQLNSVVSSGLAQMLGVEQETEQAIALESGTTTCPLGCTINPTPEPAAGAKQQLQGDPIPYVRDVIADKFAKNLAAGELETVYALGTSLWWRSDDGYRIRVDDGKTLAVQVPTTQKAYQLAPGGGKSNDVHPALRHPQLEAANKEIIAAMKKLDFKQTSVTDCPVDESYDPFDNCIAAFTHKKSDQKCLLIAGYGKYEGYTGTDDPYLRLDLTCSDQYERDYALESPYLYALKYIDPDWARPDMAIYRVQRQSDSLVQVDFGYAQAYFEQINDNGLRLAGSTLSEQTCSVTQEKNSVSVSCP